LHSPGTFKDYFLSYKGTCCENQEFSQFLYHFSQLFKKLWSGTFHILNTIELKNVLGKLIEETKLDKEMGKLFKI